MSDDVSVAERRVQGTVNYIRNAPDDGGDVLEFVTEDESQSTMVTLPGQPVWVHDARGSTTDLDREGFLLVAHRSEVADFEAIEEDPAVDQAYGEEIAALLERVTGAARVLMLGGGKKRFGERATDKLAPLANAKPARYPHADNTNESSAGQAAMIAAFLPDLDVDEFPRWALYNIWRCVTPPPQDIPLAVCDARTLSPADEVTVTAVTTTRQTGDMRHDTTSYRYSPEHRWNYFPDMTRDEVIIFKTHDSDPARARRVAHTAFDDPTCPAGTPTRASVEMRALAVFT